MVSHDQSNLVVYYCLCGEFVLACDRRLEELPRRPMDKAHVLRCLDSRENADGDRTRADVYRFNATQGTAHMLRR